MPGYDGGGWGGAAPGEADYGAGMGTKGSAAADHSIGIGGGISNKDFNEAAMEAFKEAINRALGYDKGAQEKDLNALDQIAQENLEAKEKAKEKAQAAKDRSITKGTTHGPQSFGTTELDKTSPGYQEAVNAPLAAPAKTSPHDFDIQAMIDDDNAIRDVDSQVDSFTDYGKMDESQFDDPRDNSTVGTGPGIGDATVETDPNPVGAYSGGWADVQTETETSPTDYGTMATEEFDSGPRDRREQISQSIVDRFGMPGNPHQSINLDSPSREALKNNPNMENVAFQDLAFDMVELEMDKQPNSAVEAIFGFINKAFNPAYGLGVLAKSILGGLGFEVNPNLGQRALAAAITAFEGGEIGTKGIGGQMEGERNDGINSINEEQAMKILTYIEPWAKGLSGKQIKYYFDRPEELKWVRNLWSSMNPTTAV